MGLMPRARALERPDNLSTSVTQCLKDIVSLVAWEYRRDAGCGRPGIRQALTTYQMSHQPCPAGLVSGTSPLPVSP